jgi:hypothetical protein
MEHRIFRVVFTFVWLIFYSTISFTITFIVFNILGKPIPEGITGVLVIGILLLSNFQSVQTVDIFYSLNEKFWQAIYLSLWEFWGQLFLALQGKHKKQPPDKLEIKDETLDDR